MVFKELHIHTLKMNFNHIWHHIKKFNSKWIIDLHIRTKPIKLLEENIGQNRHNTGFDSDFLNMITKAQATRGKNKLNYIEIKQFLHIRGCTRKRVKRQSIDWGKIFANQILNND